MDAFSQLLESYLSTQASPLTDCLAEEGLKRFFKSFSTIMEGKGESANREDISLGAALSGLSLANAGYGTVHGIAGILGGLHPIPHGSACGILMPPVMRHTLSILMERDPAHPSLIKAVKLGRELKGNPSISMEDAVFALISQLDIWEDQAALPSLREYSIRKEDLKKIAALSSNSNNSYAFSEAERLKILENCY
jgi:alcohol dehydrogenase